jgi:hypothetical protein
MTLHTAEIAVASQQGAGINGSNEPSNFLARCKLGVPFPPVLPPDFRPLLRVDNVRAYRIPPETGILPRKQLPLPFSLIVVALGAM